MGMMIADKYYAIGPAEHEVHFIGLQDYLNANPRHAFGYRGKDAKIDPFVCVSDDGADRCADI